MTLSLCSSALSLVLDIDAECINQSPRLELAASSETLNKMSSTERAESERAKKRLKTDDDNASKPAAAAAPSPLARCKPSNHSIELPTDVWSHICHFLPYSDVKHVAAVNKTMLEQVMPSILRIYLFSPKELNARHAKRLCNVERVYIYCLLKNKTPHPSLFYYSGWSLEYQNDTKHRVVPYLSSFQKLQYVFMGGLTVWQGQTRSVWNGRTNVTTPTQPAMVAVPDRGSHGHAALVHAICGALAAKSISSLHLEGLFHARAPRFCPNSLSSRSPCRVCQPVLQHFPSSWLMQLPTSFLCVSSNDRLQRVVERGDSALLRDKTYIENLITKGFRQRTPVGARGRARTMVVVVLTFHAHQDLKALSELQVLDLKTLAPSIFYKAMQKYKKHPEYGSVVGTNRSPDRNRINHRDNGDRANGDNGDRANDDRANSNRANGSSVNGDSSTTSDVRFCPEDFDKLVQLGIPLDEKVMLKDYGVKLFARVQPAPRRMPGMWGRGGAADPMAAMFGGDDPLAGARPPRFQMFGGPPPGIDDDDDGMPDLHFRIEGPFDAAAGGGGMDPLYANIFDRVRNVVRERFGDDMERRFGIPDDAPGGAWEAVEIMPNILPPGMPFGMPGMPPGGRRNQGGDAANRDGAAANQDGGAAGAAARGGAAGRRDRGGAAVDGAAPPGDGGVLPDGAADAIGRQLEAARAAFDRAFGRGAAAVPEGGNAPGDEPHHRFMFPPIEHMFHGGGGGGGVIMGGIVGMPPEMQMMPGMMDMPGLRMPGMPDMPPLIPRRPQRNGNNNGNGNNNNNNP